MARDTLDYARPEPPKTPRGRSNSLARIALAVAISAGTLEATTISLIWIGVRNGHKPLPLAVAGFVAIVVLVSWVVAVALALAASKDQDGPRRTAKLALLIVAAGIVVAAPLVMLRGT